MNKNDDFLKTARKRFDRCVTAESNNRGFAIEALRFRNGEQWPSAIEQKRKLNNQPCLTLNRIPAFIRQVVNDIRQIRPTLKIRPVDSQSDPETAEIMGGMIKAIEQTCNADTAYDWAAEYAVIMGWGFFRITTQYSDDDGFEQDIIIERISNPFSVYMDPDRAEPDGSDMKYCFVVDYLEKETFEAKYPGKKSEWPDEAALGQHQELWYSDDKVRVAEYWTVEDEKITLSLTENGIVEGKVENYPQRTIKRKKVAQYIITGQEILETNEWAGKYIPIIPVLGEEINIEGETYLYGMVKDLMDSQRQYNYWRSASTERVALAPKAPFIGYKGQFKSPKWKNANVDNYAYLEADIVDHNGQTLPLPQRQMPPDISPGMIQEIMAADNDMKAISSIYPSALGDQSNETAGVAINARKRESDVSNFHFMDNLSRAMKHGGRVLVDLIPKIYDTPRMVRIVNGDGTDDQIQVNQPYYDQKTGKEKNYNLQIGKYDVTVDIGPSYTSQRQEAAEAMLQLMQSFPQAAPLIGDLLAKAQDWPEADEVAKRLRMLLPAQIVESENPQVQAIVQQAQQQVQAVQQQMQQLAQYTQDLEQAVRERDLKLQDKSQDMQLKLGELRRKYEEMHGNLAKEFTELDLKYNTQVPGSVV